MTFQEWYVPFEKRYGPGERMAAEASWFAAQNAMIDRAVLVVDTEEKLAGEIPRELMTTSIEELCRATVRATKHSISRRIRAMLPE